MQTSIRQTTKADIPRVMEIIDMARQFMWSIGNTTQWPMGYPARETIEHDVALGNSYVCCNANGKVVATFCFAPGPDETYAKIEDGAWLNEAPYHVIHRIASDGSVHGIGRQIIDWCKQHDANLRLDTHADNKVMQALAERNGFERCGIIHVANGTPRIAYQLTNEINSIDKKNNMMEINHIGLYVADLEKTKAFFDEYFGAKAGEMYHNPKSNFRSYMLSFDGGARLEIMTRPGLTDTPKERLRTGFIHLSLSVGSKEQVDALAERLSADGYDVIDGPRTTGDGYYECCVVGIEGNLIEITV